MLVLITDVFCDVLNLALGNGNSFRIVSPNAYAKAERRINLSNLMRRATL